MSATNSGWTTPLSSSSTLSTPGSPRLLKAADLSPYRNPRVHASALIEYIASRQSKSSSVYVYDVAEQVGFGTLTKEWAKEANESAKVIDLQTRAGAGLSLVGRLSQGTSRDAAQGTILTAYTTPSGLASMAPSFAYLPDALPTRKLVVQVPTATPLGKALTLSPSLSPLASIWSIFPKNVAILLSSTPQQAIDFATLAYHIVDAHVVHLFDHHSASRETGHSIAPLSIPDTAQLSIQDAVKQAGYSFFEYHGSQDATTAVVLLNGPFALTLKAAVINGTSQLGVVIVNVYRPWDDVALEEIIPTSVKVVHVLEEVQNSGSQGTLYVDVFGALWSNSPRRIIASHILPHQVLQITTTPKALLDLVQNITRIQIQEPTNPSIKKLLFFNIPRSPLSVLPTFLENLFASKTGIQTRLLTDHDVFSKPGGIASSRLLISRSNTERPIPATLPIEHSSPGHSDFLAILDQSLLKTHSILQHAKAGSIILITSAWSNEELLSNLPEGALSLILERNLSLFSIDVKSIATNIAGASGPIRNAVQSLLAEFAFLRLYLGSLASEGSILQLAKGSFGDEIEGIPLAKISAQAWSGLRAVVFPNKIDQEIDAPPPVLRNFEPNAIAVEIDESSTVVNGARLSSWHDAAKHLLFPSIYSPPREEVEDSLFPHNPALRPEVPDKTFLVTCTVNKRLTPLEYDRNVFHLEFDTAGTGLKYAIGEALGIHGWNDEQEVLEFCEWYGVDNSRLITIPLPSDETRVHTRTVMQALQQQVDIFGKPPKSFYTDLAEYATSQVDQYALRFIGSPEGAVTFKKLAEKDTVTFADILKMYPSARPGIERLCEMIEDIKPRHYSIASAQSVVGDRVDLLVVTVDWFTPSGSPRYGQCTRYLAGLKIGQKVTVSIKPSVMKLPPNLKQPLIMAGLGTGAAPFRAFLQHLAWRASEGDEIGPVYYYFGSRYQGAEYLYGEEIEAFILGGIITRAGLAFSRDGPKKVYIQHKMLEDSEALAKMLHDDNGVFYLCGPTWPVPDVYEALVNALVKYKGSKPTQAGEYLESLKEEERYVLEVY
ncbi:hypothetical protein CPB83DRAFT_843784 [Crepidotus variabilis]|uniref:assimilatory sulfite reductase (NADPH) n=1 Tax=Crepidotus variabilis TaxID=179855 RepID=A0A9P6ESJ8_9AGAR|nr:hypothetical protein CPB83DRAFT_843784 [Crepidotus variabilis]